MSEEENFEFFKENRKYIRTQVTKLCQTINSTYSTLTVNDKIYSKTKLTSLDDQLKELNAKIIKVTWDKKKDDFSGELDKCQEYEDKICKALSLINLNTPSTEHSNFNRLQSNLKFPELPLPEYSNSEGENLESFFANFESIIAKYNLDSFEKFIILQKQVKNSPRIMIDSLESTNRSYEAAKEILVKAFGCPLTQKYETIKRLSELRLNNNDDPYKYIGDMNSILDSIKRLKIDVDTISQYFIWSSLNEIFQNQFIQIINKNKPSLQEIKDNLFDATERYLIINKRKDNFSKSKMIPKNESKTETYNLASNITYKNKFNLCCLCVADKVEKVDHKINKCEKYRDPNLKLNKIKLLKGCVKCANLSHTSKTCMFKFKNVLSVINIIFPFYALKI